MTGIEATNNDEQTRLRSHAGEIYRQYLIDDIITESETLKHAILSHYPLCDLLRKIEFSAYIFSNERSPQLHSSKAALDQCLSFDLDENVFGLRFDDMEPIPLCNMRSIRVAIANQTICSFRPSVETVDLPYLELCFCGQDVTLELEDSSGTGDVFRLRGCVSQLNEEDLLILSGRQQNQDPNRLLQTVLRGLSSPNAVFTPTNLRFIGTNLKSVMMNFVQRLNARGYIPLSHIDAIDEINVFRRNFLEATGDTEDGMLQRNYTYKIMMHKLAHIGSLINEIQLGYQTEDSSHLINTRNLTLSSGRLINYHFGNEEVPAWSIPVMADTKTISSLYLLVSGVPVHMDTWEVLQLTNDRKKAEVKFKFSSNTVVCGFVSLENVDISEGELHNHWFEAFQSGKVKYSITSIIFELASIRETLEVLGIDYCNDDTTSLLTAVQETLKVLGI